MAKKKPQVQIEYRSLSDLEKLPNNPRYITEDDMETLKESLKSIPEYLEAHPIVLSDRTGKQVIIDGNQRMEAARLLGWEEVPTVLMHGLTEEKEREIIIRANVTNGKWDYDILGNEYEVDELEKYGVDVDYFKDDEWGDLPRMDEAKMPRSLSSQYVTVVVPNEKKDILADVKTAVQKAVEQFEGVEVA